MKLCSTCLSSLSCSASRISMIPVFLMKSGRSKGGFSIPRFPWIQGSVGQLVSWSGGQESGSGVRSRCQVVRCQEQESGGKVSGFRSMCKVVRRLDSICTCRYFLLKHQCRGTGTVFRVDFR